MNVAALPDAHTEARIARGATALGIIAIVLADVYDWSDGALSGILLGLVAITVTVGSLLAPE